jgi:hypothetical protein
MIVCFFEHLSSFHVLSLLCSLHHSYANRVTNDNVHQGLKVVFNGKDIHSSLNVMREKGRNLLLNICFTIQNNSRDNILKCIRTSMEVNVF